MDDTDKVYIVDASTILSGLLLDEIYNTPADRILEVYKNGGIDFLAPSLLTYETINGIKMAYLRKRITEDTVNRLITLYKNLEIKLVAPDENHILSTAIATNLSVYDSAYVSLMIIQKKPLITADKKLYNKIKKKFPKTIWIEEFK